MKNKQTYLVRGSFALLFFVILGYIVKFYPATIMSIDTSLQTALRGDLPSLATTFFKTITTFINTPVVIGWVSVLVLILLFYKKWKAEALLLGGNLALSGILIVILKNIYQRPRPSILHLIEEHGYSFPSGHAMAATFVFGSLIIICQQRIKNQMWRRVLQGFFALFMLLVIISRPYLGVHYPSDVLAGFLVAFGILSIEFPFYDRLRFQWRFTGKQK